MLLETFDLISFFWGVASGVALTVAAVKVFLKIRIKWVSQKNINAGGDVVAGSKTSNGEK